MNDGEISGNDGGYAGGVNVGWGSTFTMNGGKIKGNTNSNGLSGGLDVRGTFTMNGGEISNNTGGLYVEGTFIMNGGEIKGNIIDNDGGGVYVMRGNFIMNSGKISGNSYGVRVRGTFTMNGGEIFGNTASHNGGGVYVAVYRLGNGDTEYGTFLMSGGTIYGSSEGTNSNTTTGEGAALYKDDLPTAEYGTFSGSTWIKNGDLETTDATIRVVDGVWQSHWEPSSVSGTCTRSNSTVSGVTYSLTFYEDGTCTYTQTASGIGSKTEEGTYTISGSIVITTFDDVGSLTIEGTDALSQSGYVYWLRPL
jgi:hypothetical protein